MVSLASPVGVVNLAPHQLVGESGLNSWQVNLASTVGVVNLASLVGVVLTSSCGQSGPPVGVVNLAPPDGVVDLAPPVGEVDLTPPVV